MLAQLLPSSLARVRALLCIVLLGMCVPLSVAAQPYVTAYSPLRNTVATALNADVVLTWSEAMSTATLTSGSVRVFGSQTGLYSTNATFSYSAGNTVLTVNPALNFKPGEQIRVVVANAQSSSNVPTTRATVWGFTGATGAGDALFNNRFDFSTGGAPRRVALGDINGDGMVDMVTANYNFTATVLLGDGMGSFSTVATVGIGEGAERLALGDINNDGFLDMAIVESPLDIVRILLGDGTGNFSTSATVAAGTNPRNMAMDDLNGDGNLDFVVVNEFSSTATAFLGDGAGAFSSSATLSIGSNAQAMAVGDVNGDGAVDILVGRGIGENISVFLGDGTGGFSSGATVSADGHPYTMTVGDVNGDGLLDVITANGEYGDISVLLGDGYGSFSVESVFPTPSDAVAVAVGDINGDGMMDIVVTSYYNSEATVYIGDGTGVFSTGATVAVGQVPISIALGDVDNNGTLDIATGNFYGGTASVLLNAPALPVPHVTSFFPAANAPSVSPTATIDITFSTSMNVSTFTSANIQIRGSQTGLYSTSAIVYNNATNTASFSPNTSFKPGELISVTVTTGIESGEGAHTTTATAWSFIIAAREGEIGFTDTLTIPVGSPPQGIALGDVNGDGFLDIATVNAGSSLSLLLGDNAGLFSTRATASTEGGSLYGIALGDMNNDGSLDIVYTKTAINAVEVLLGNGVGIFYTSATVSVGATPRDVVLADMNGDGNLDVATVNANDSTMSILLGTGTGDLGTPSTMFAGSTPRGIVAGDVNNDGIIDIVLVDKSSSSVLVFMGDGTGSFTTAATVGTGVSPENLVLGDVNGDGNVDIATANANSDNVTVLVGNGLGNFSTSATVGVVSDPFNIAIGDMNGDGNLDLATVSPINAAMTILLGDGTGNFVASDTVATGTYPTALAIGDINNDGWLDIVSANLYSRNVSIHSNTQPSIPPVVTAVSPAANAVHIAPTASVDITFSTSMSMNTLTSTNIQIRGSQTGLYSTNAIVYNDATHTISLSPSMGFKPGEEISVTVSKGVQSSDNVAVTTATVWSFLVASAEGSGTIQMGSTLPPSMSPALDVVLADMNGDGILDAITVNNNSNTIGIFIGDGAGNFSTQATVIVGDNPSSIALSDVNGDGYLDVLVANYGSDDVYILLGDGTGNISTYATVSVGDGPGSIVVGDVNGDGHIDALVANVRSNNTSILFGDGAGNFSEYAAIAVGNGSVNIAIGDVNSDGNMDALVMHTNNRVTVLLGDGAGNFSAYTAINGVPIYRGVLGDVNNDGNLDALIISGGNKLLIYIGDGTGVFSVYDTLSIGSTTLDLSLGDVNGDGNIDVVVGSLSTGKVSVLLGDGAGNFTIGSDTFVAQGIQGLAVGDVNGDGLLDVVAVNYFAVDMPILLGLPKAPATVTSVTVSALNNALQLTWSPSTTAGVTHYEIYHSTTSGNLSLLATVPSTTTTYTHSGLSDGIEHFYAVKTVLGSTSSNLSAEVSGIPNTFAVLYPHGGEVMQVGIQQILQWQYSGDISSMRIEYSADSGLLWTPIAQIVTIAGNKPLTTFNQEWVVPDAPTTTALVRVVALSPTTMQQTSGTFVIRAIAPPTNLVASAGSTTINLSWTLSTSASVSGYRVLRGTTSSNLTEIESVGITTTYTDTQASVCTNYIYALQTLVGDFSSATSNPSNARITLPENLTVHTPNGGEVWQAGVTRNITWSSTGCSVPSTVVLEYSTNNGGGWSTIATVANTGSYAWSIPNTPSTQALVRISDNTTGDEQIASLLVSEGFLDQSDAVFTIAPIPVATDLMANAGDGSVQLHWTASNAEGLTGYSIWRGTTTGTLSTLATVESATAAYTDNTVTNCTLYIYTVKAMVGELLSEASNEAATAPQIAPEIFLSTPNGGERWHGGQTQILSWSSTGCTISATVTLAYSANNGSSWNTIATVPNTGNYVWTIPNTPSTEALVRVSGDGLSDESNAVFTLLPLPVPMITISSTQSTVSLEYCPGLPSQVGVNVQVADPLYDAATLTISATSSDQSVVADNNIVQQGGTGATTTLLVTPSTGHSGTAVLTITASNGYATTSTTVTVQTTVFALPNAAISGSTSACAGAVSERYSVASVLDGMYAWTVVGGSITSGAGTDAITVDWGSSGIGSIGVVVTTANGCKASSDLAVVLHANPVPSIAANGATTLCSGEEVILTAYPAGADYLWSNGTTSQSIRVTQSGVYSVTVSNEYGCTAQSTGVAVTVHEPVVAHAGGDATICSGNGVQLNGSAASSVGNVMFVWSPSAGLSNASVPNPIAAPTATTVYSLTVVDGNGCSSTASVTVTVMPTPVTTLSSNAAICAGGSTQLEATGGTSYSWSPATSLSNAAIANPIASPSATTTYTATIYTASGCSVQRSVTVTVEPPPVATANSNAVLCVGGSTQLEAAGGTSYSWSPATGLSDAAIANPVASPSATTTYTVTVYNAGGCSSTASVTVTVKPVTLTATVLLEGAYSNGSMRVALQQQSLLPPNQPYAIAPYNYAGTETLNVPSGTDIVDWVLVDLRGGLNANTLIERRAALLRSDGIVVSSDGGAVEYPSLPVGTSYYVVVWHRNHLGVMSRMPVVVTSSCDLIRDFASTAAAAYSYFGNAEKLLGAAYGMIAGDTNGDGIINAADRVDVRNDSGMLGYDRADITLDGIVNAADRVIVRNNNFMVSQVP